MNPYEKAKKTMRAHQAERERVAPGSLTDQLKRLEGLSPEEFQGMIDNRGGLAHFLGNSSYARSTESRRLLEIAKGTRHINGTAIGDVMRLIDRGRMDEARCKPSFKKAMRVLNAARLADPATGRVDAPGIRESLKQNRIVRGRL